MSEQGLNNEPRATPFLHYAEWFELAESIDPQPQAAAFATSSAEAMPSVRMVLVRHWGEQGFDVFTDLRSGKSRDISSNPHAELNWHWKGLGAQVRASGSVISIPSAEVEQYWSGRPRESQISASVSNQSAPIEDRLALDRNREKFVETIDGDGNILLPDNWGGFRVVPVRFEFWVHDDYRFHHRIEYRTTSQGGRTHTLQR